MKREEREMFQFAEGIAPYFRHKGNEYYRVQGLEKLVTGSRNLFYASNIESGKIFGVDGLRLERGEWLGAGTFRNSVYIDSLAQLTQLRDLHLYVDYEGAARIKLMCAVRGKPAEVLADVSLLSEQRTGYVHFIGSPTDLPEGCRVFWHVDAMEGGVTLHEIAFCTSSVPKADCRLAVMLRTFGRTTDIKALLKRFADAGSDEPYYATILDNVNFWVLDTTADAAAEYREPWLGKLNLRILAGPNLGGGGNAGHMLKLFDDACRETDSPPTELLILDDDLSISMESIARYFMFCAYRVQEVICSLPILMKSRPTVVWEDGGFWGRLNFHEKGDFGKKRNLFPNLLKHGMSLAGYDKLDEFGPLNTCEYSTFIFYGMSMKTFRKIGFPAPFFLRGDDIELSLRAHELGVIMITNPNLAAWHEPAHSYGQEYMAILHGILINFTYSDQGVDFYARYFEERFHEHASINDLAGLKLYHAILQEILDPESLVLTPRFQRHYMALLKEWGAVRMLKIPDADREAFERNARENKVLLVPFVYPGYHKDAPKFRSVVVINHSAKAYRELPPCTAAEKGALGKDYMGLIARLSERFDDVRATWRERLAEGSSEAYWRGVQELYKGETKEVAAWRRTATDVSEPVVRSAVSELVATRDARLWWRQLKENSRGRDREELANEEVRSALKSLVEFVHQKPVNKDKPGWRKRLFGPGGKRGGGLRAALPDDFDPEMYLALNADVADAGVNPAEHYLKHGMREGRKYRA
jgi:hypothetical protein